MMCVWSVVTLLFSVAIGAHLPSNIPVCALSRPDINECIAKGIETGLIQLKDGNRELGVPKLDPVYVEKMEIGQSGTGSVVLNQLYKNVNINGVTKGSVSDFKIDLGGENCHFSFKTLTPNLQMVADYELKGQVLIFPINGHGKCVINMLNMLSTHDITCKKFIRNGKEFIKINKYSMTLDPEKVEYNFENIVAGNERLSNEILKTVNENALDVYKEVKSGMEQIWSKLYQQTSDTFFSRIPRKEIFPDK